MMGIFLYITISILAGCISCFFGKRLYFPILMLTVFTSVLSVMFSLFGITWKVGLAVLAVGIIAALLSVMLYKLGVFLMGAVLGAGIGQLLFSVLHINVVWFHWILVLAPALFFGFCALKWCQLFIMASTAYGGAAAVILPLGFLAVHARELSGFIYADGIFSTMANLRDYLQVEFAAQYAAPLFICTLIMAIVGFWIQHAPRSLHQIPDL